MSLRSLPLYSICVLSALSGAGQTTTLPNPPQAGLVGWWKGNGDATDSSGNGFNGTLYNGMGFTNGIAGQAFAAGSGRKVHIPDNSAFALSSISIAAWIYPRAFGYAILSRGDNRPGFDPYTLGFNGQFHVGITIENASNVAFGLYAPTNLPTGTWSHVAGTFDGQSGDTRVYVNGALVAEATNTAVMPLLTLDPAQSPELSIGNVQGGDFPFQGFIEDVLLYSRALSPAEITQISQLNTSCLPHGAKATAVVINGFVVGATITDPGCGYTNPPTVLIAGGGGSGATGTAVLTNGSVSAVNITNAGIGYTNTPTIYIYSPFGIQLSLTKAVRPAFTDLVIGAKYQVQTSADLSNWTNLGAVFTATNPVMSYPNYLDADFNSLSFRVQAVP